MKDFLQLFWLAVGFYTRLPTPKPMDYSQLSRSGLMLPLIGWIVGGLTGLSVMLANMIWSQNVAIILALSAGILLTGAFHEDGFADVCDGFGGGYDKSQILTIMKDSQIGTYGGIGLVLLLLLKINLLNTLPAEFLPLFFFAGHSVSRLPPLLIMRQFDYARVENSKSQMAVFKPNRIEIFGAGIIAVLPLMFMPLQILGTLPVIVIVNNCLARYFYRHIAGYTGDCLGASQQLAETVFYLSSAAIWTFI